MGKLGFAEWDEFKKSSEESLNRRIYDEIYGYHFVNRAGLQRQNAFLTCLFPMDDSFEGYLGFLAN